MTDCYVSPEQEGQTDSASSQNDIIKIELQVYINRVIS